MVGVVEPDDAGLLEHGRRGRKQWDRDGGER